MKDINDEKLKNGSIIDIHQTVNGCNTFLVFIGKSTGLNIIYYRKDLGLYPYEYDIESLLEPSSLTGEIEWEIIGNIFEGGINSEG